MHILKVGFNYKTAPVEVREKLTFSESSLEEAMVELKKQKSILENVIISTCNRTEVYAVVDQIHTGRYYIKSFLADWFDIDKSEFYSYLRITEDDGAMDHLFRVTTGLDSMVLGETQILGQVKEAFQSSQKVKTTGTIFNELFKQAITFGKKAHKETAISEHAVSVSYAAVELAKKIFGDLQNMHVAILGAGEMGELAVKNLQGSGVTKITVVNRTVEKAEQLADQFNAAAVSMDHLPEVLESADILITSTGSDSFVVTEELLESVHKQRKGNPLFLVDIAVPRDIEPGISDMENIFLYDIDDLHHIVDANLEERKNSAEKIEMMLEAEIVTFKNWLKTLGVVPVISALRQKASSIQSETMKSIERKMPDLTEREKKVLNKHTKSIVNQMLKDPITQAKELAGDTHSEDNLQLFIDIFGIEEEVKAEYEKQMEKDDSLKNLKLSQKVSFPTAEKVMGH